MTASNDAAEQARSFHSRAPEQTRRAAAALARAWRETAEGAGLVISLRGDLGAGKTVFVKGLAEGLGLDATQVSSPTFVLANSYAAPDGAALHHVDFYRIEEAAELEDMGFFDLMAPGSLLAVEWGERFDHALPRERLEIVIERAGETDRRIGVTGHGPLACAVVRAWRLVVEAGGAA